MIAIYKSLFNENEQADNRENDKLSWDCVAQWKEWFLFSSSRSVSIRY